MNNNTLHTASHILLIVGGLNWLLTAFGMNVVELVLGSWPMLVTIVYVLIGLAAVYALFTHSRSGATATAM